MTEREPQKDHMPSDNKVWCNKWNCSCKMNKYPSLSRALGVSFLQSFEIFFIYERETER